MQQHEAVRALAARATDVRLTQLTAAGQAAFGARAATATLSRDADGALAASGLPFVRANGPCELSQGGRCARRGRFDVCGAGEHCDLVVGWGGALGACPIFHLYGGADVNRLIVGGTRYYGWNCPQGARVAAGATITWDVTRGCGPGAHNYRDGWEICF